MRAYPKGQVVVVQEPDPWAEAASFAELEFKQLLRGRVDAGIDALEAKDFDRVLEIWQPLLDSPFLNAQHEAWSAQPYFRAQIQAGKTQLVHVYAQLAARDVSTYVPKVFAAIAEVVCEAPNSARNQDARTQNLEYKGTLAMALEWGRSWRTAYIEIQNELIAQEVDRLLQRVRQRIGEIDRLLRRTG